MTRLAMLLLCFITAYHLSAQRLPSTHPLSQDKIVIDNPSHLSTYMSTDGNAPVAVHARSNRDEPSPAGLGEYLVKFKGSAYDNVSGGRINSSLLNTAVVGQFTEFEKDINSIGSSRRSVEPVEVELIHKYYKTYYGAHLRMTSNAIQEIRNLPYVEYVVESKKYEANLGQSVALVKADQIWETYETKGEGIRVGIIDTGIDYTHPALGGGFGDGFKVEGGYDFVNEDTDPMDDHDHGTHVAGIVAANSDDLIGVAPEATLYGLKALDSYGSGYDYQIIAAIEWTVDPNGDNDPSDRLDVVNMSLGGRGDAYDPLADAVNAAVEMGVVYCVAAGNNYDFWQIGTPGTAEKAITVGASDKYGNLAFFSSKGPANGSYAIKPDILAPGVDINSSIVGGGTAYFNGTSMATPHVAGLAALLLDVHPTWSPENVKSALVTTAQTIGEEVLAEGSGEVNGMKAIEATTMLSLSNLSFGKNDINLSTWEKSLDLTITNVGDSDENYSFTNFNLAEGIELVPAVYSLAIEPGNSATVAFDLQVDNEVFSMIDNPTPTRSYSDVIEIVTNSQTYVLPWSFMSTSELTVVLDDPNYWVDVFVYNEKELLVSWNTGDDDKYDGITFKIPSGTYDVLAYNWDRNRFVLKENITVDKSSSISISKSDVDRKVEYTVELNEGLSLAEKFEGTQGYYTNALLNSPQGYSFGIYGGTFDNIRCSYFSSNYALDLKAGVTQLQKENALLYDVTFPEIRDIEEDVLVKVSADELTEVPVFMDYPSEDLMEKIYLFSYEYDVDAYGNYIPQFGFGNSLDNVDLKSWSLNYIGNNQKISLDSTVRGLTSYIELKNPNIIFDIHNLALKNGVLGSIKNASDSQYQPKVTNGESVVFGRGLLVPTYYWYRSSTFPRYLSCQMGGQLTGSYELYYYEIGENDYHSSGEFDWYGETITYKHTLYGTLNSYDPDYSPIKIQQLYLTDSEGAAVSKLPESGKGKVRFTLSNGDRSITESRIVLSNADLSFSETFEAEKIAEEDSLFTFEVLVDVEVLDQKLSLELFAMDSEQDSMRYILDGGINSSTNHAPEILAQSHVSIDFGESYLLDLDDLVVTDKDHSFPADHELLDVEEETSLYSKEGLLITPSTNSKQTIEVPLQVSDGLNQSEVFNFNIHVGNKKPTIISQKTAFVLQDESYTLSLDDLTIEDLDNTFPDDFTIEIVDYWWNEYYFLVDGNDITPVNWGNDYVTIPIQIFDGTDYSPIFNFKIFIRSELNTFEIVGQTQVIIEQDSLFTMDIDYLQVLDPEYAFPNGYTLTLKDSYGLEVDGDQVKVISKDLFEHYLTVELTNASSEKIEYSFVILIRNGPIIQCPPHKTIDMGSYAVINYWDLCIYSYKPYYMVNYMLHEGENYTIEDNEIYPDPDYYGILSVGISAFDGELESEIIYATIVVQHPFAELVPEIVGQEEISIFQDESFTLNIENLMYFNFLDEEIDSYSLNLGEGDHYSLVENEIIPDGSYVGTLNVPVQLIYHSETAGDLHSNTYSLSIDVAENEMDDEDEQEEVLTAAQFESKATLIFPNPAHNQITIRTPSTKHVIELKLVHVSGQVLRTLDQKELENDLVYVNVLGVPPGLYFLKLKTNSGTELHRIQVK